MADLMGVPIFRSGKWNNMSFTDEDLDDMVANFEKLGDAQRVPLKIGHDRQTNEQLSSDGKVHDGQPAVGWIQNLRRVGSDLVADFVNVPRVVREAIKNKLFRTVSIELLMGVRRGKEVLRHVLDGVAILGADQPAVHSLGDLDRYLAGRSVAFDDAGHRLVFETIAGERKSIRGDDMDEKQVQAMIDKALSAQSAKHDEELSSLKKKFSASEDKASELERENKRLKAEADERKETEAKAKVKFARDKATGILEAAVKAEKITPAQRETFTKLFGIDDDQRVVRDSLEEEINDTLKTFGVEIPDKEGKGMDDPDANNREKDVFKEVERRVRAERAKDDKLDYGKAFRKVMTADPKLHAEYLNTDPPVHFQMGGAA